MPDFDVIEMKPFVPAKDYELSKRFYQDVGFTLDWNNEHMAYLHHGSARFLLHGLRQVQVRDGLAHHGQNSRTGARTHRTRHTTREQADRRVQAHAVLAAFVPLAGLFFLAFSAQRHGLLLGPW